MNVIFPGELEANKSSRVELSLAVLVALSISCVRPKFLKISFSSLVSFEHDFTKKSQLKSPVTMSSLFSALADSRTSLNGFIKSV